MKLRKRGSNQHKAKYLLKHEAIGSIIKVSLVFFFILSVILCVKFYSKNAYYQWRDTHIIASPCTNFCAPVVFAVEPVTSQMTVDELVNKYANKYGKTEWMKLRTKAMLHYMLLRESAYGNTKSCGDSGKACGPLQFWADTYTANAKRMMNQGLRDHIGNRLDLADSIEVASWMINIGQENQWGPIARKESF